MINLKEHPIIQQYIIWNRFGDLLGMDFEVIEKGHVIYKMGITKEHLATPFAAHGGSLFQGVFKARLMTSRTSLLRSALAATRSMATRAALR